MSDLSIFFPDARLPELGKIKIGGLGEPRQSHGGGTYRVPMKYDHFVITGLGRGADKGGARGDLLPDEVLMKSLASKYADPDGKLRKIPIFVLSNDLDDIMQTAYVWYGGRVVGARSDGKRVTWFNDRATGKPLPKPIEEDWKPEYLDLKTGKGVTLFKMHTRFGVVIADKEAGWGGQYVFRTTSTMSSRQLYAGLLHLYNLTGGILVGLPMLLALRPVQVAPDGKAITVYIVHLDVHAETLAHIQLEAMKQAQWQLENRQKVQVLQLEYRKLVAAPGLEPAQESADINDEFQPETVGDTPPPPPVDPYWAKVLKGEAVDVESTPVETASTTPEAPTPDAVQETPPSETETPATEAPDPLRNEVWAYIRAIVKAANTTTGPVVKGLNKALGLAPSTGFDTWSDESLAAALPKLKDKVAAKGIDVSPYLAGSPEFTEAPVANDTVDL